MANIIGFRGDALKNLEILFIKSKFYYNFARNFARNRLVSLRGGFDTVLKFQPGPA